MRTEEAREGLPEYLCDEISCTAGVKKTLLSCRKCLAFFRDAVVSFLIEEILAEKKLFVVDVDDRLWNYEPTGINGHMTDWLCI